MSVVEMPWASYRGQIYSKNHYICCRGNATIYFCSTFIINNVSTKKLTLHYETILYLCESKFKVFPCLGSEGIEGEKRYSSGTVCNQGAE